MDKLNVSNYIPMQNQNVLYKIFTIPTDIITYILFFDNCVIIKGQLVQIKQIDKKLPIYKILFDKFKHTTKVYHPDYTIHRINKLVTMRTSTVVIHKFTNTGRLNIIHLHNWYEYILQ